MSGIFIFLFLTVVTVACNVITNNSNADTKDVFLLRRMKRSLGMKENCVPLKIRNCFVFVFEGQKKKVCIKLKSEDCISVD